MRSMRNVFLGMVIPMEPYDQAHLLRAASYTGMAPPVALQYGWGRTSGTQFLTLAENSCAGIPGATVSPQHRLSQLAEFSGLRASAQANMCNPSEYSQIFDLLKTALPTGTCK
jgi:hypothetical protein